MTPSATATGRPAAPGCRPGSPDPAAPTTPSPASGVTSSPCSCPRRPRRRWREQILARSTAPFLVQGLTSTSTRASASPAPRPRRRRRDAAPRADVAMYAAKSIPRLRATTPRAKDRSTRAGSLLAELRTALDARRAARALPAEVGPAQRRRHRRRGPGALEPPRAGLLPAASSSPSPSRRAASRDLTSYVLARPLRSRGWRSPGLEARMAVNLSVRSLLDAACRARSPACSPDRRARRRSPSSSPRRHDDTDPGRTAEVLNRLHDLGLAVDRRLRHRVLVARLPAAPAGRRDEDRQVLRIAGVADDDAAVIVAPPSTSATTWGSRVVAEGWRRGDHDPPPPRSAATSPRATTSATRCRAAELRAWLQARRHVPRRSATATRRTSSSSAAGNERLHARRQPLVDGPPHTVRAATGSPPALPRTAPATASRNRTRGAGVRASRRAEPGDVVEHRLGRLLLAQLAVVRDREAVRLVTHLLEQEERLRVTAGCALVAPGPAGRPPRIASRARRQRSLRARALPGRARPR